MCKCEIEWVSEKSGWKSTPDDNQAIGYCRLVANIGTSRERWFPICENHLAEMPLNGSWEFVTLRTAEHYKISNRYVYRALTSTEATELGFDFDAAPCAIMLADCVVAYVRSEGNTLNIVESLNDQLKA